MTTRSTRWGPVDRRRHAGWRDMEVVRYDKAGKWYLEPTLTGLPRQLVTLDEAVQAALWGKENADGVIVIGLPGGYAFDRKIQRMMR